jgi:hypothetical protein
VKKLNYLFLLTLSLSGASVSADQVDYNVVTEGEPVQLEEPIVQPQDDGSQNQGQPASDSSEARQEAVNAAMGIQNPYNQ